MFEAVCESKFFRNCWLEYLYTTSQYDQDFLRTWYMGSALEMRERQYMVKEDVFFFKIPTGV